MLLLSLTWVMKLTDDLFIVFGEAISGRDLILLLGGAFLIAKVDAGSAQLARRHGRTSTTRPERASFGSVLVQIGLIDIVFSLDSVITAVGLVAARRGDDRGDRDLRGDHDDGRGQHQSRFVEDHPTIKMLALSFLLLIGVTLIAEGFDVHVPKGYIYFAMAFSFGVEMLNIRVRARPHRADQAAAADRRRMRADRPASR